MTKRSVTKKPKLTQWFDGSKFVPYHVGEYNAGIMRFPDVFRWWDGKCWSDPYRKDDSIKSKNIAIQQKLVTKSPIHFRGLAQNPEVQP